MPTESSLIARCLEERGYTPPARALPELLDALGTLDEEDAERLERVLAAANGQAAGLLALARLSGASVLQRRRLLGLVKRVVSLAPSAQLLDPLLGALEDEDAKCRRLVVRALGNLADPRAEPSLIARLSREALPEQRALVEALGKFGGAQALRALTELRREDAELRRRIERAELLIQRRRARGSTSDGLAMERALGERVRIAALCRRGLAELLAEELAAFSPKVQSPSRVDLLHSGTLSELLVARTALDFALVFELDRTHASAPIERIARTLAAPHTARCLARWTDGPPRFRLDWDSGHRRQASWEIAKRLAELDSPLLNDPRGASWTARVASSSNEILLVPRLDPDPRFLYRERAVEGASHPTIAAALARLGGARENDVVWDPFVGSGLELVERARFGSYARLIGSDLDPRALDAARANLSRASVAGFELVHADARTFTPKDISLILSNPPMGRRVTRDGTTRTLLGDFLAHAARVLVPGGRLVWLSAFPTHTESAGRTHGLRLHSGANVDLGGFDARVQIFTKG